jgi:hypothetical protein
MFKATLSVNYNLKNRKIVIASLIFLLLAELCLVGAASVPAVHASTNWTLTTSIRGSVSSMGSTVSMTGTETIQLTENNGQLSGTGEIQLSLSASEMTLHATGTETLTGTVSADRTAHLTITRAIAKVTGNAAGQSINVPASAVDVPLDTPYDIKLQNGFTQNYNVPDFGTVTLTVRSGGTSGQHKVTFTQTGVPDGTTWWVKVGGTNKTTTSSSIIVDADDGTYAYQVGIACPASTEDFPLQLTQIRTTSSGAAATTQATVEDIVFVDGLATKPDSIGWWSILALTALRLFEAPKQAMKAHFMLR